jgi:hypothetical protein
LTHRSECRSLFLTPTAGLSYASGERIVLQPQVSGDVLGSSPARYFFETLCGLAMERRTQVAASAALWDTYLASLPVMVQRALFALLRPVARARGYRASYVRFDGTFDAPVGVGSFFAQGGAG